MFYVTRIARAVAVISALALSAAAAHAQADYPNKPVRLIVPYQAGQGTDTVTRYLAEHLSKDLGQPFIVENIAGAGGNIGTHTASRAAGDGYTLVMGTNATHALNEYLYSSTNFDPVKDFKPVALIGTLPMVLLARADGTIKTVQDVQKQAAQASKGALDVGLPSTTARLVFELFKKDSGAKLFSIPYSGSAQSMTDLMGGQVPLAIDTILAARAHVAAGKLQPVAVTSLKQTALLPGVATVAEQGVPGFEVVAWNALYAVKDTPDAVVARLNQSVQKFLDKPETRQRLLTMGMDVGGGSAQDLARFAQGERQKWAPVIESAGLKLD